jgi:predicted DsbA family dithiol-disulfide isomerase
MPDAYHASNIRMTSPLEIDVVSDVVCPWCFIGTVRLEEALGRANATDAIVAFRPFQLHPSTPTEGLDLREWLSKKYGRPAEKMFGRVETAARESGIPLDFAKVTRLPNTLRAHTLLGAAKTRGTQRALARALFDAYFLEGHDIGDPSVLGAIGAKHGFGEEEALALLANPEAQAATRAEAADFAAQGIAGVPFTIIDGKYAVSGAQTVETFASVLERARSLRA